MSTHTMMPLGRFLAEYKDRNDGNLHKPVAVGRYGIRTRESIYSKELAKDYSKNKLIYKDTLTIGMGSKQIDIGILSTDEVFSVSPAYHTFRISGISSDYLRYCLECRNEDMSKRFMVASARQGKTVDIKRWKEYLIPVYDEDSQADIVRRLDKVSAAIESLQAQYDKLEEVVKSRFIEMFGNPLTPENWELLSEAAQLERGRFSPRPRNDPQYYNGIYPFVQTGDIANCDHRLSEYRQTLNEKGIKVSKSFPAGTILIAIVGATIGATAILQKEMYAPDSVIGITPSDRYEPVFMEFLLRFWREELLRIAPESARANINLDILGGVKVLKASLGQQKEFIAFMEAIDKSKLAVTACMDKAKELKAALMQEYFG